MEKIIWFWNLVHFNVFIWRNKVSGYLLTPFFKLLGSSTVRNLYKKRGVSDPDSIVKDAILNPANGSNSIRSGGTMGVLLLFICAAFFQIYTGIFGTEMNTDILQLPVYFTIIIIVNYYTLYKEKKYLNYFEEFNSLPKERKTKYSWLCFGFIIFIILFLIGSFMFETYMFHQKSRG